MANLQNKRFKHKATLLAALIVFFPGNAQAYVDPGFLSSVYQLLYVFIFGFLASLVFKPWNYLKSLFSRKKKDNDSSQSENKE